MLHAGIVGSYNGRSIIIKPGPTATQYVGQFLSVVRPDVSITSISGNGAVGGIYTFRFPDDPPDYNAVQNTASTIVFSRPGDPRPAGSNTWTKDPEPSTGMGFFRVSS